MIIHTITLHKTYRNELVTVRRVCKIHIIFMDITFWSKFVQFRLFSQIIEWRFVSLTSECCVLSHHLVWNHKKNNNFKTWNLVSSILETFGEAASSLWLQISWHHNRKWSSALGTPCHSLDFPQESDSGEVTRHSVALSPQHARSALFSPLFRKRLSITKPVLLWK